MSMPPPPLLSQSPATTAAVVVLLPEFVAQANTDSLRLSLAPEFLTEIETFIGHVELTGIKYITYSQVDTQLVAEKSERMPRSINVNGRGCPMRHYRASSSCMWPAVMSASVL